MRIEHVDPANPDSAVIAEAGEIIRRGGLVAFPTETVYGLGADATNAAAVESIFNAKGRPSYNPLIVHVRNVTQARRCVTAWPAAAQKLADAFWPGPLTIVLPKTAIIAPVVTAGLDTVGIRVPGHPVALALLAAAGVPIAAPSANRSMHVSPTSGAHVAGSLERAPDLILEAGPSNVGIESTVIDLSSAVPTILRPGMISLEDLRSVVGDVKMSAGKAEDGVARPSPGMMDRHYSPRARVVISGRTGADAVADAAVQETQRDRKVVVLSRAAVAEDSFAVWRMPETPAEYARVLYATLHRVDDEGYDVAVIERLPDDSSWDALRDRVTRSAR